MYERLCQAFMRFLSIAESPAGYFSSSAITNRQSAEDFVQAKY
jgi:hypothetical protein